MDDQPSKDREIASCPAIIGAGTMGRNIAVASAVGGRSVTLFDVDEDALADAKNEIRSTVGTVVDRGMGTRLTSRPSVIASRTRPNCQLQSGMRP